ncbi:Leaf rust 10 disease-resistance locus receptor-like protein kinase [Actinidia chinensis var. chinensis]|uniref:non-specific serine/threonine protein kinase n=1 Tax=Actinidia chinensis var. chinensis TaxID=1590841 RepID=A0A2R6P9Z3_ACTCC|nr:Leaf rust 10 disease-resistance locus receptor-like protein kinase [Actinidia chinensis var. chinensis]
MNPHLFQISRLSLMIVILSHVRISSGANNERYTNCDKLFQCANIQNIGYPFWGGTRPENCGHPNFELNCQGEAPKIIILSRTYRVLSIDGTTQTLTVVRDEFWHDTCPTPLQNATLDTTHFGYASNARNVTLYYGCPSLASQAVLTSLDLLCSDNRTNTSSFYLISSIDLNVEACTSIVIVQVNQTAAEALAMVPPLMAIGQALDGGFGLHWEANKDKCDRCVESGGVCGSKSGSKFACYCSDQSYPLTCNSTRDGSGSSSSNKSTKTPANIAMFIVGAILTGVGLGWGIFTCRQRRDRRKSLALAAQSSQSTETKSKKDISPPLSRGLTTVPSTNFSGSIPSFPSSKFSEFGKASTYFGVQVFSYAELEEATGNFDRSRELGDGGFGTVYYGKLQDGRVVAVKRLYENNFKRLEQFLNEVEILTRLRHDNLVILYGCTSKRSRELLLVYEYIPNGTVADHLHGNRSSAGLLSWPIRLSIALETAYALAYLHASDIIHRDVKTTNILLDNDFHVKVADFGLSRLFPTDVTHVSTAPQGTPGYVDPEYYQCYQLTEKSDVYSFGVVLIELISSKQAVDTNRDRHDINLSNMAVNKIQNHALHELVDPSLGFETNSSVRRRITFVAELAFRCLQTERDMRPSMEEVVTVLRGIKNEEFNAQKAEVVDIVIGDEVGLLTPDSTTPNSIG